MSPASTLGVHLENFQKFIYQEPHMKISIKMAISVNSQNMISSKIVNTDFREK